VLLIRLFFYRCLLCSHFTEEPNSNDVSNSKTGKNSIDEPKSHTDSKSPNLHKDSKSSDAPNSINDLNSHDGINVYEDSKPIVAPSPKNGPNSTDRLSGVQTDIVDQKDVYYDSLLLAKVRTCMRSALFFSATLNFF